MTRQLTRAEKVLIDAITDKCLEKSTGLFNKAQLTANLVEWHLKVTEINLEKLLGSTPFDLAHDVYGIAGHISRDIPYDRMQIMFLPRCNRSR